MGISRRWQPPQASLPLTYLPALPPLFVLFGLLPSMGFKLCWDWPSHPLAGAIHTSQSPFLTGSFCAQHEEAIATVHLKGNRCPLQVCVGILVGLYLPMSIQAVHSCTVPACFLTQIMWTIPQQWHCSPLLDSTMSKPFLWSCEQSWLVSRTYLPANILEIYWRL